MRSTTARSPRSDAGGIAVRYGSPRASAACSRAQRSISGEGGPDSAAEVQKKAHAESMKATENVVKKEEEDAYTIDNIMKYQEQVDEMHAHVASSAPVPKKPVDIGETNAAVQRAAHEIYEDSGMPDIVVTSLENSDESNKFHMSSEAKHFIKDLGQKQRAEKA